MEMVSKVILVEGPSPSLRKLSDNGNCRVLQIMHNHRVMCVPMSLCQFIFKGFFNSWSLSEDTLN